MRRNLNDCILNFFISKSEQYEGVLRALKVTLALRQESELTSIKKAQMKQTFKIFNLLYQLWNQGNLWLKQALTYVFAEHNKKASRILLAIAVVFYLAIISVLTISGFQLAKRTATSLVTPFVPLQPLSENKSNHEVFGFAPFWTIDKIDNVDFETLTTLAYFGVPVNSNGTLDKTDQGYTVFKSKKATNLFKEAHNFGTRVVLTLTLMKNGPIIAFLDNQEAQDKLIKQATDEVQKRGIDGINVDFEYSGNPGLSYQKKFNNFVDNLTLAMHQKNPNSKVTVSVYAASVKDPKMYDIATLSQVSDGIFMMAYDFAPLSADQAIPTSPLYGYKEGKYWYDVSTAVDDFLTKMPAEKLILGVPWYGYNYSVKTPKVLASTNPYWLGRPTVQTYASAKTNITPDRKDIKNYREGWDENGKVGWKAYYSTTQGSWRMVFVEDPKSLDLKYDLAKKKNLAGVGIWALGFDQNTNELWHQLRNEFGKKTVDASLLGRVITSGDEYD